MAMRLGEPKGSAGYGCKDNNPYPCREPNPVTSQAKLSMVICHTFIYFMRSKNDLETYSN
jgi:hypothetical protein